MGPTELSAAPARGSWAVRGSLLVVAAAGIALRLLAWWRIPTIWDEVFTGAAARLPVGRLLTFLRDHDPHPPLDYLIRGPLARHSSSVWTLRIPSVVASVAAFVVFCLWMRRFDVLGVVAAGLMGGGWLVLQLGSEARMYAALTLAGVTAASASWWWLRSQRRLAGAVTGAAWLVALLLHASALFMGPGLLLVAGHRTDRRAWEHRAAIAAAGAVWAALWGRSFVTQLGTPVPEFIPLARPASTARVINQLVDGYPALALVAVALLVTGGSLLVRRQPVLGRVWCCCFAVPLSLAVVSGTVVHVLSVKTLVLEIWGPPIALAAVVDEARRRWNLLGVATGALVALLIVPSTVHVLSDGVRPDWRPAIAAAAHHRESGDAVAVGPGYLRAPAWFLLLHGQPRLVTTKPALRGLTVMTDAATFGGRVWTITESGWPGVGAPSCSPAEVVGGYRVSCLEVTSTSEAPMAAGLLISTAG